MKKGTREQKSEVSGQQSSGAEQLLPCPFCGGEAETVKASINRVVVTGCVRSACMASVISVTEVEGRQTWNLRIGPATAAKLPAPPDAVAARLEGGL